MFCDGSITPSKRKAKDQESLQASPRPLPCKRGAIRKQCQEVQEKALPKTDLVAFVETAYKGRSRTTMRVRVPGQSSKASWAEVTAKQHAKHKDIICKIAAEVNAGRIVSRQQALALKDRLLVE
eukprot:7609101-Lingulodinium_polyedra.AAC.3